MEPFSENKMDRNISFTIVGDWKKCIEYVTFEKSKEQRGQTVTEIWEVSAEYNDADATSERWLL